MTINIVNGIILFGDFMGQDNDFYRIIKECSCELGIKLNMLSYDYIYELKKGNMVRHIIDSKFDLNSEAAAAIACDKYATYEVLKNNHVPVIEHMQIFNPKTRLDYVPDGGNDNLVREYLNKYKTLVVKPNDGREGIGVALCNNIDEVKTSVNDILSKKNDCVICPYYDIETEYRSFYLDDEICLIYGKEKPNVIGDGTSNIKKLVSKLNLPKNNIILTNLSKLDMNYVPKNGERIELSWKFNLSGGATPHVLDKGILYDQIEELAKKAGKTLNLTFATIDIIRTKNNELYVLEINSSIGSKLFIRNADNGYNIMKEVFKKAIIKMFKE